jgi:hypothetical protein
MRQAVFAVPAGTTQWGQHTCGNAPADRVLGGGFGVVGDETNSWVTVDNRPNGQNRWIVAIRNDGQTTITVSFYAICARVS